MKAYETRRPPDGLIYHSDRGSQYCSHEYQQLNRDYNIRCNMSRKAQCLDNASAETFFHSMKVEWFYGKPLQRTQNPDHTTIGVSHSTIKANVC